MLYDELMEEEAQEVAYFLSFTDRKIDNDDLRAALINALQRIARLESRIKQQEADSFDIKF